MSQREPYVAFAASAEADRFFRLARHVLDGDDSLSFITAWGDLPPGRSPALRPCSIAMLLGRPGTVLAPTLFRQGALDAIGGLDERLPRGAQAADAALRALGAGRQGAVLDAPEECLRASDPVPQLYEKHFELLQSVAEEVLFIRELWVRHLAALDQARHRRHLQQKSELAALDEEAGRLRAALEELRLRR